MKGCLIILACIVVVGLLILGSIGYYVYSNYSNFPEYAKREVVYKKYEELLKSIDLCVIKSDSKLSLAANLEKIKMPDELIYLALEKAEKNDFGTDSKLIEITKKIEGKSTSRMIINGSGYGRVNGHEVIIIEYDIEKFNDLDRCIIYLKYLKKNTSQ